jgi:hypothetical protein
MPIAKVTHGRRDTTRPTRDAPIRSALTGMFAYALYRYVYRHHMSDVPAGSRDLPDAVEAVWPCTTVQAWVVHLLRNSFRYAARR